jgi:hypothetical protein
MNKAEKKKSTTQTSTSKSKAKMTNASKGLSTHTGTRAGVTAFGL